LIRSLSKKEFVEKFPIGTYELIPYDVFLSFFVGNMKTRQARMVKRAKALLEENVGEASANYFAMYHRWDRVVFIGLIADCADRILYWFRKR